MTDAKPFAILQAAAALRGITVRESVGSYYVSHGVYMRSVESLGELAALLERMGVKA